MDRRTWIKGVLGASCLGMIGQNRAAFANVDGHRFVFLYFGGGWDVLLGPDARLPRKYTGIDTGYDLLDAKYRTPYQTSIGGRDGVFGMAMKGLIETHRDVLTIFNGVSMDTVSHEVGRAYINSFKKPSGASVRGSSLATHFAANSSRPAIAPNVAMLYTSYNRHFSPELTPLRFANVNEVRSLLAQNSRPISADAIERLNAARMQSESCVRDAFQGRDPSLALATARMQLDDFVAQDLAEQLKIDAATASQYGIANVNNGADVAVRTATIYNMLKTNLTRSVSAQIIGGLDDHAEKWNQQPNRLEKAFDSVKNLVNQLRQDDPTLKNTTVVMSSEFSRTPKINGTNGRDHWLVNSIVVLSGSIRPGIFGASKPQTLGLSRINTNTGLADDKGEVLFPERISATLLSAIGADYSDYRVNPLTSWIL